MGGCHAVIDLVVVMETAAVSEIQLFKPHEDVCTASTTVWSDFP